MEIYLSKEKLINKIIEFSKKNAENQQVVKRLEKLLPIRLQNITERYTKQYSKGKSLRLALKDLEYCNYLDEIRRLSTLSRKYRVLWESYSMFYYAKQATRQTKY